MLPMKLTCCYLCPGWSHAIPDKNIVVHTFLPRSHRAIRPVVSLKVSSFYGFASIFCLHLRKTMTIPLICDEYLWSMVKEPMEVSHGVEGGRYREGMQLPQAMLNEEFSRKRGWTVQVWNEPLHKWPQSWAGNRANEQKTGMNWEARGNTS